ncbi:MAG: M23 family metallopeptidase [Bacteroidales bacterium]|nr:M23 family metallopeptidase [Bacteroidales bacterium]
MEKKDKKTRNFRFSLIDAQTHERLWSIRFTRPVIIWVSVSTLVVAMLVFFCIIAFTPIRTFIPGYPDAQTRRQAVQNSLRIDSLQTKILQWELYSENLRRVVAGEEPIRLDNLILGSRASAQVPDSVYLALRDSLLRKDVASQEQFGISSTPERKLPIEALSFFTPVKGVVSKGFERSLHPWVDVTAPSGSTVMAVLDGSVIYTGWDDVSGYIMVMQHSGDIVSIYKNNQKLLRKSGDSVKAGTAIGMVASSASLTKGDHLHFELWYAGAPVDPALYISF